MVGVRRSVRRQASQFQTDIVNYLGTSQPELDIGTPNNPINLRDEQATIPPQVQQLLNSVLGGVVSSVTPGQGISLSERLTQLEEAYETDLITTEEYNKVRQASLDSMDDY